MFCMRSQMHFLTIDCLGQAMDSVLVQHRYLLASLDQFLRSSSEIELLCNLSTTSDGLQSLQCKHHE